MAVKKQSYEENIAQIDEILEKLESEELSLDDSISEYEKAIKLIKDSEKLLEAGEGKVMKVLEKNGKVWIKIGRFSKIVEYLKFLSSVLK